MSQQQVLKSALYDQQLVQREKMKMLMLTLLINVMFQNKNMFFQNAHDQDHDDDVCEHDFNQNLL